MSNISILITPLAMQAFDAGDEATLQRVLHLKAGEPSPLFIGDNDCPEWFEPARWKHVQNLRDALIEKRLSHHANK